MAVTVVRIEQTVNGWKPVKNTVATPGVCPAGASGTAKADTPSVRKTKANSDVDSKATLSTDEIAPKSVTNSLVALAKKRSLNEAKWDEKHNLDKTTYHCIPNPMRHDNVSRDMSASPGLAAEKANGSPALLARTRFSNEIKRSGEESTAECTQKSTTKDDHSSNVKACSFVALAKRKAVRDSESEEEWKQEWGNVCHEGSGCFSKVEIRGGARAAARTGDKKVAKPITSSACGKGKRKCSGGAVPINPSISYSGVVTGMEQSTGNLLIDCAVIMSTLGQPVVIHDEDNPGGVRVGSILCFKVELIGNGGIPLAKDIVINGFDDQVASGFDYDAS